MKHKRKIVASLTYGKRCPIWVLWLLFIMEITFMLLISTMMIEGSIHGTFQERLWACLALLFVMLLWLFVLVYHGMIERKIRLWIKDSVELTANSKQVAVSSIQRGGRGAIFRPYPIRIRVYFKYNGRTCEQSSGEKKRDKIFWRLLGVGYRSVYNKYADRKISILYSPKYDEVLILKDEK